MTTLTSYNLNIMKKLLLIGALLLCTLTYSQVTTFVRKYTYFVSQINGVKSEVQSTSVTAVFNENNENTIVVYINGNTHRYFQISKPEEGVTTSGVSYQTIDAVREVDGTTITVQLFENNLRLIFGGDYIEFL